jgi:Flp pilus assembly pilin Flp
MAPHSTIGDGSMTERNLFVRFLIEEDAQDVVEYALLAAFLGIAGWAAAMSIRDTAGQTYASWLSPNNGIPSLWDPAEPCTSSGTCGGS